MAETSGSPSSPAVVAYDRELVPWLIEPWAEVFIDLAAPAGSDSVLDVACGTGLITKHLVHRLGAEGRICAVDIDPDILGYAASTVVDPRLSWQEADATTLPFGDDTFDGVLCHQGLQFFPDRGAALREMRRVLVPHGRLTIAVWGSPADNPWPAVLAAAVRGLLGDAAGDSLLAVCRLGDRDELATVLADAGFGASAIHQRRRTTGHPDLTRAIAGQLLAMPSGSALGDLSPEQRTKLTKRMTDLLAGHTGPGGELAVPSSCLFATATKQ